MTCQLTLGVTLLSHNGLIGLQVGDRDQVLEQCLEGKSYVHIVQFYGYYFISLTYIFIT